MKCQEMLAALSDYVDGDLEPGLCEAFEEHLADCNPCEIVVDNLRNTVTIYKAGKPYEMPPELHEHLCNMLRTRWKQKFPNALV